jgi:hypothetical protein
MTTIRKSASGPFIDVGNTSALARFSVSNATPLPELGATILSGMVPIAADEEARIALIIVSLAFLNETGFDGAPCGGVIGLQAGPDPINLGGFRFNPIGPGEIGNPLLWTAVLPTIIQPGTSFALFGSTNAEGGNIGGAARVVPAPSGIDGYSFVNFVLL